MHVSERLTRATPGTISMPGVARLPDWGQAPLAVRLRVVADAASVGSDAGSVGSDAGSIGSDAGSVGSDAGSIRHEVTVIAALAVRTPFRGVKGDK